MGQSALVVNLPDDIYERVRRAARGMRQPMETALANIVKAATPSLEKVPLEYRADLETMEDLDDESLWEIAGRLPTPAQQRRMTGLLEKNRTGKLPGRERRAFEDLRATADLLMLWRSYAYLLLKFRGHQVPSLADWSQ